MLLLLEIMLTVAAWRQGWRSKALIPVSVGLGVIVVLGLVIGVSVGASGGCFSQVDRLLTFVGVAMDILVVLVLAVMASNPPRPVMVAKPAQEGKQTERLLLEAPQV